MDKDSYIKALEDFVLENPDLELLESKLAEFNVFEATGAVRQELRHSDFLSFLLDPQGNHGLGDAFLRLFLIEVTRLSTDPPFKPIEFDLMHLDGTTVTREWENIDILIHDEESALVCFVENKVFSAEHSNQLERYWQIVRRQFPNGKLLPVFLTPEGAQPTDERYAALSYGRIAELVDSVIARHSSTLGSSVRETLAHYSTMLGRHIVADSEIAELCRRIYRRHQRAVDLILEHRPDLLQEAFEFLVGVEQ